MMKKAFYYFFLCFSLVMLTHCGSDQSTQQSSENKDGLTANITSIHYIYSLEKHQEVLWTHKGGLVGNQQCATDWFIEITALLESATIHTGLLEPDQFHTTDNPLHKLTVTYKDGSQKVFKLHIASSYQSELTLSNTVEVIAFFNRYFDTNGSCPSGQ
jgi:hypothetical protein